MSHQEVVEEGPERAGGRGGRGYKVCINCASHPWYPEIPAVTLHHGSECLVCHCKPSSAGEKKMRDDRVRFGVSSLHHFEDEREFILR